MGKQRIGFVILCLVATAFLLVLGACAEQTPAGPSPIPTSNPLATRSEQPDKATFRKYFSEMGLGKMPAGATGPQDLQRNVTFFTAGDQICLYGNIIQECQLRDAIYDVGTKEDINEEKSITHAGDIASLSLDSVIRRL